MHDMTEEAIEYAFRRRIQAQALWHLAGVGVDGATVYRFRKAGTWDADIAPNVPPDIVEILRNKDHPKRVNLPFGPVVAVNDGDRRAIIEVGEHLLNPEQDLREASLQYFLVEYTGGWPSVTPHVRNLLESLQPQLLADDEDDWIEAGLQLHDAIEDDFLLNLAGVRQCAQLRYDEGHQLYMTRVFRPRLACFENLLPPVWNFAKQTTEMELSIQAWAAESHTLSDALNAYLYALGSIPLAEEFSAGRLALEWRANHTASEIWDETWNWESEAKTPLATYHACDVFIQHPEWIPSGQMEKLTERIGSVLDAGLSGGDTPLWNLRCSLSRHFLNHVESLAPGLDGTVVAACAWWLGEMVAALFGSDANRVKAVQEQIIDRECSFSSMRRVAGRSSVNPSPLRNATLYSPSIWADALLATAVRKWDKLKGTGASKSFRQKLLDQLSHALVFGRLEVLDRDNPYFAFQKQILPEMLDISDGPPDDELEACFQQFSVACEAASDEKTHESILTDFAEAPETTAMYCAFLLRTQQLSIGVLKQACQNALNSSEWRYKAFHLRTEETLDVFLSFLIEWQLQQTDEWNVRVSQILAYECMRAESDQRRKLLFAATLFSALAVDVASPVIRLLSGSRQTEFAKEMKEWRATMESVSSSGEAWLSTRIRGFLATVAPYL